MKRNPVKTLTELYGTGHYNPRSFDRRSPGRERRLYLWGMGLLLLAVAATIGLGFYLFAGTPDSFTGDRIKFTLDGPTTVRAGTDENYTVRITNEEEVDLTEAEIFIGYNQAQNPGASVAVARAGGTDAVSGQNTWPLGVIAAGASKEWPLSLRFSGQLGGSLTLPLALNFRPKDFSSNLSVKLEQKFTLAASSIGLVIDGPTVVSPNAEVELVVAIATPSFDGASDWVLRLSYPESFKVSSLAPEPKDDGWRLQDLPLAEEKRKLLVRGTIAGAVGEQLKISAQLQGPGSGGSIAAEKILTVQSSAASIALSAAAGQGKKLQWDEASRWQAVVVNTGSDALKNLSVSVNLQGEDLWQSDSLAIEDKGFFEAGTVIWDEKTTPALASLEPGQKLTLSFSLKTRLAPPANLSFTPAIAGKGKLRAKAADQEITVESEEVKIKILSNVEFDAIGSSGADKTYVLTWKIDKSSSELKDLRASAVLGRSAKWLAQTDYNVGELTYNEGSRTVEWKASKLPPITTPINIRFNLGLAEGESASASAILLQQSTFSATDALANEPLDLYSNAVRVGDVR